MNIQLSGAGAVEEAAIRLTAGELGLLPSSDGIPVRLKRGGQEGNALQVKLENGEAAVEYRDIPALLRGLRLLAGALESGKDTFVI